MNFAGPLPEQPWGILIAIYFVLIGVPAGLGLVNGWLATRYPRAGSALAHRINLVSLVSLIAISTLLIVDLGRPGGFFLMLTRFNVTSPISVGAKLIALKAGLLAILVYAELARRRRAAVPAARPALAATPAVTGATGTSAGAAAGAPVATMTEPTGPAVVPSTGNPMGTTLERLIRLCVVAVSFALAIYPASVLARTWGAPLAASSGSALLFVLTSLVVGAGGAAIVVAVSPDLHRIAGPVRRLLQVALTGYVISLLFEALTVVGDPRLNSLVRVTTEQFPWIWWGGVVGLGLVLPAVLLGLGKHRGLAVGGLAAAGGAGLFRYLLFAIGG